MKKLTFITICALILGLTGCFNPVFANIEKEEKLTAGNVPGTINAILRYTDADGDWIVVSNGSKVFYKEAGIQRPVDDKDGVWTVRKNDTFSSVYYSYSDNKEFVGKRIINLGADSENIYALTCEIKVNAEGESEPCNYEVYYTSTIKGSEWTLVDGADQNGTLKECESFSVFSSNAVEKNNRSAYLRCKTTDGYEYFKLGASLNKVEITSEMLGDKKELKESVPVLSVISFGGQDLFFTGKAAVSAGDTYYYSIDSEIYKQGIDTAIYKASGKRISTLSVTSDYLIFTCGNSTNLDVNDGGIYHIDLDRINASAAKFPLSGTDSFATNAAAVMTSSYEIRAFLVENPEEKEAETNLYASLVFKSSGASASVSYENVGLWAYYPEKKIWDRE